MEYIQLTLFGKTSPELSVPTKERISGEFCKNSQKPKFQYLKVENGRKADWLNYAAVQSLGGLSTPSIGAFPSEENVSFLSRILEVNAPEKYYLSPKACQGILRRAQKRGKELPPLLKAALEAQAEGKLLVTYEGNFQEQAEILDMTHANDVIREYGDKSPTLQSRMGTGGNQVPLVFEPTYCIQGNVIDRADTAGANGKGVIEGKSYTLNTVDRPAVCYAIGNGQADNTDLHEIPGALNCMHDQQGVLAAYPINTQVVTRHEKDDGRTCFGIGENGDPSFTLQEAHSHGVIYAIDRAAFNQGENALYDFQIDDSGICSTLVAKSPSAVCYNISGDDVAETLDANYYRGVGARSGKEREVVVTPYEARHMFVWIVRRLTPTECERLQGFSDDWTKYDTKGNELKDTPRYKALGNSIAIPCAERVFKGILDVGGKAAAE